MTTSPITYPDPLPGACTITLADQRIDILPDRAAWWPATQTLILADVHLGKAEALAHQGVALPGCILDESLTRLSRLINALAARRVTIVGDLLHAPAGLTIAMRTRVASWRATHASIDFIIIPGNHDHKLDLVAREWNFRITPNRWLDGPFAFVHDPADIPTADIRTREFASRLWWTGHIHPCVQLGQRSGKRFASPRADSLKLPCFVLSNWGVCLPAFSLFTAGVPVDIANDQSAFAIAERTIVRLDRKPARRE